MPNSYPPAPWSQAQLLNQGIGVNTQLKPAMCEHNGRLFLAWATWADFGQASTFTFTRWNLSDDGWEAPTNVALNDSSTTQSYTSALAVYNKVLYAFVPYASQSDSSSGGLSIFSYNETANTFDYVCNWSNTWNTSVTAAVCDGVLHVVGYNQNDGNHFVWTWTNANLTTITSSGDFSANTAIAESTTSNPALFVRDGQLRLLFLAAGDGRGVLEDTLTMGNSTPWARTDTLDESGNSGVSGASRGKRAWICFKTHNGSSNLICHYKRKNNANCWSSNISMGSGEILEGLHEAALACSGEWLYAVWNTYQTNGLMYYSRRPIAQMYPEAWMGDLADQSLSLSALSIPGTHDSATAAYSNAVTSGLVKCQSMDITEQLDAGIRYFDLRAGYASDTGELTAYHGDYELEVTFADIFESFYDWLAEHPTEGIVAQIKGDEPSVTPQQISNSVYPLITAKPSVWILTATIPTVAQLRGKIQLVRRFPRPDALTDPGPTTDPDATFGVDGTDWKYNTQGKIPHPYANLWVEDNCLYDQTGDTALAKKTTAIEAFIDKAVGASADNKDWFIGFSSYTTKTGGFPVQVAASNKSYAKPMNQVLEKYVHGKGRAGKPARVGTILMDYPELPSGTLIDRIIYTNDIKPSG